MYNAKLNVSKRGLLKEALVKLHIEEVNTIPVRDNHGIIGYEINNHVLVAKPMFYRGTIVSCHKDIAWRALKTGKKILFYISSYNSFHEFVPSRAMEFGFSNTRGGALMINFEVSIGQRVSFYDLMEKQLTLF